MKLNGVDYELVRVVALAAEAAGVDPALLAGIVTQESGWNPTIDGDYEDGVPWSHGLGQVHRRYAGQGYTREQLYNPEINARLAATTLRGAMDEFGQTEPAVAAYNQGIYGVHRDGYAWNLDRYVRPVLAYAEDWRPFVVKAAALAHIDAMWGITLEIGRRTRSTSIRSLLVEYRGQLLALKAALGLNE